MDEPAGNSAEAVFRMEPAAAIVALARVFVDGQRQLAQIRNLAAGLPAHAPVDAVAEMHRRVDAFTAQWNTQQVPNLAASMRLALEVLDTYGPEGIDVEDPTDAAIWNNKYFVWLREFGGQPPQPPAASDGTEGDGDTR